MKFAWMDRQKKDYPVKLMCATLKASRSGYYAWLKRPPSAASKRREALAEQIRRVYKQSRGVYGSPRVHRELRDQGIACCENTVAKMMRQNQWKSKMHKAFKIKTTDSDHDSPIADNVLDRRFDQAAPNRVWAGDITYVPTDEGWLYLAVVLDLYSRRVIGWSMSDHLKASLAIDALSMAIDQRLVQDQGLTGLVHHSDRGVQYASDAYRTVLASHGVTASMSRRGNCYDNAMVESFFGSLKTELVHHEQYETKEQAMQSIFEYIEVFYNRQRRHSSLGYVSPIQFEAA